MGTLAQGKLAVFAKQYLKGSRELIVPLLLGLVLNIKHPVFTAVANHLKIQGVTLAHLDDIKTVTGKGVEGIVNNTTICAGNSRWLGADSLPQVRSLLSSPKASRSSVSSSATICMLFSASKILFDWSNFRRLLVSLARHYRFHCQW
jgi:cation transport ATPase